MFLERKDQRNRVKRTCVTRDDKRMWRWGCSCLEHLSSPGGSRPGEGGKVVAGTLTSRVPEELENWAPVLGEGPPHRRSSLEARACNRPAPAPWADKGRPPSRPRAQPAAAGARAEWELPVKSSSRSGTVLGFVWQHGMERVFSSISK